MSAQDVGLGVGNNSATIGTVVGAHGATLELSDGTRLIDLAGGDLGYSDPRIVGPVSDLLRSLPLSTRSLPSRPLATLASRLAHFSPDGLEVCYFCNSAGEAIDGALKLAKGLHPGRRQVVIVVPNLGDRARGAVPPDYPLLASVHRSLSRLPIVLRAVPYGDRNAFQQAISKQTCAVVVEPVFTGAGVATPPKGYLAAIRAACNQTGAVFIADETITGLGRTGERFAMNHVGVAPDVMVIGSALGGGVLPMAAYVSRRRVHNRVYGRRTPALHGSTTGGNPVACAAALAALSLIEQDNVVDRARQFGFRIDTILKDLPIFYPEIVQDAAACGLLGSITIHDSRLASAIQAEALARGSLVLRQGSSSGPAWLTIRPPLLIGSVELDKGLSAIAAAVQRIAVQRREGRSER